MAQQVSNAAPLAEAAQNALPDSPGTSKYPDAQLIPEKQPEHAKLEADYMREAAGHTILDGAPGKQIKITYNGHTLQADHAEYDENTGEAILQGHVLVTGGENDETIHASHATMNVKTATGRFYDVTGSVGMKPATPGKALLVYANGNPFLFSGRLVIKTGPNEYEVYDGTVTSCQLPRPDWLLSAGKFTIDDQKARAANSIFHLMGVPLLYLPYVTHPRTAEGRQSGLLIPVIGDSSSKGLTAGEQIYWAINRSTDLTVGFIYYSDRGWAQTARFQYKGVGQDFVRAHYSGLQDRGYTPSGGTYTNQSGVDVTFSGRHDFIDDTVGADGVLSPEVPATQTRVVADVEYLSSFLYREAFTDNFNQAVSSDVNSIVYGTHEWNGFAASLEGDRYQGEKRVATTLLPEQQVHIFHAPSIEFTTTDHRLGLTPLRWSFDSSATALKRIQPNFETSGMIERLDLRPELALPFSINGWRFRPSIAGRETFYSRSRLAATFPGQPPVESTNPINRADGEVEVDIRPPELERTFDSGWVKQLLHHDVKHTIEPEITYRYVGGIGNFQNILRFDAVDVMSNTNELDYGVTQRLFLKRNTSQPCRSATAEASEANANEVLGPASPDAQDMAEGGDIATPGDTAAPVCGNREWISWRIGQKYFFNSNFGGAVSNGPRNILDTSLGFTGIAFLTRPRDLSPLISRLRVRTSEKIDVEWDLDYDFCAAPPAVPGTPAPPAGTCAKRFTANNVFVDVHQGSAFGGISFAWLDAPAISYVEGVRSSIAEFDQMRILLGWGKPTHAGFSVAANAGLDLNLTTVQYGALETSYNWNCCGLSVEYRKYELGTARNENAYRFNFTLANIGTAGNLRRAQQVF